MAFEIVRRGMQEEVSQPSQRGPASASLASEHTSTRARGAKMIFAIAKWRTCAMSPRAANVRGQERWPVRECVYDLLVFALGNRVREAARGFIHIGNATGE